MCIIGTSEINRVRLTNDNDWLHCSDNMMSWCIWTQKDIKGLKMHEHKTVLHCAAVYGDWITLDIWNVALWKTRFQTFKGRDLEEDVLLGKHLSMKQKHYFNRHILAFLSILRRTLTVTSSRLLSLSLSLILHPFLPHHLILLFFAVPFQYHSCSLYPFSITFSLPSLSLHPLHPFFFFFF